jgi:hypothetical protein
MKKPSVPKCLGGSQKIFLRCSTSSLAVFYVEQVALNRHVRRHFRLHSLMRHSKMEVKCDLVAAGRFQCSE